MTAIALTEDDSNRRSRRRLAAFLLGSGVVHFAVPSVYERLIPPRLPGTPRFWVYFSGIWELASGALLLSPRTKKAGGYAAAATIAAVYPGNIKMALDAGPPRNPAAIGAWL